MLIFQQSGRLGNQVFQYSALKTLCQENEELILLGFEEYQAVFDDIQARIINSRNPRWERKLYHQLYLKADSLSQKKIISRLEESREVKKVIYECGIFNKIVFVAESYFQSESYISQEVTTSLTLKPTMVCSAQKLLNAISPEQVPFFVHIRRGDYLKWPNQENPAILPASYYRDCIDCIRSRIPNVFFVFTSDDPFYVMDVFGKMENSYISKGSSVDDFALMSQCQGGILSASSFSWWAAYFSHLRCPKGIFLAPKFWAGHRLGTWYPRFIETSFLDYIIV